MKHPARWMAIAVLAALLPTAAFAGKAKVKIVNQSDWDLHHFYLSSTDDDEWGPDQLGDEVIGSGESFTLTGIECDTYDVKLVDEDGDECVVSEVDICGGKQQWVIDNHDLLKCEKASS